MGKNGKSTKSPFFNFFVDEWTNFANSLSFFMPGGWQRELKKQLKISKSESTGLPFTLLGRILSERGRKTGK